MKITFNSEGTVNLTVDKNELASINDALSERIHLSVIADRQPIRGYLGRADEELARYLEAQTYYASCSLEDHFGKEAVK